MSRANASKAVIPTLRIRVGLVVMPVINGLALSCSMPALSAPSAKILICRSFSVRFIDASQMLAFAQNYVRRLSQMASQKIRLLFQLLGVAAIDENRPAPGRA